MNLILRGHNLENLSDVIYGWPVSVLGPLVRGREKQRREKVC